MQPEGFHPNDFVGHLAQQIATAINNMNEGHAEEAQCNSTMCPEDGRANQPFVRGFRTLLSDERRGLLRKVTGIDSLLSALPLELPPDAEEYLSTLICLR
jgi:hypothetical protein